MTDCIVFFFSVHCLIFTVCVCTVYIAAVINELLLLLFTPALIVFVYCSCYCYCVLQSVIVIVYCSCYCYCVLQLLLLLCTAAVIVIVYLSTVECRV